MKAVFMKSKLVWLVSQAVLLVLAVAILGACSLVNPNSVQGRIEFQFENGTGDVYQFPTYDYDKIVAVPSTSPSDADVQVFIISGMTASDIPMRTIQVTLTPEQTLPSGRVVPASALIRITELPKNLDGTYAPKTISYLADSTSGFNKSSYILPPGNGVMILQWKCLQLAPILSETDYMYRGYTMSALKIQAYKYSHN